MERPRIVGGLVLVGAIAACTPPGPNIRLLDSLPSAVPTATPVPGAEVQGPLSFFEDFEEENDHWGYPERGGRPGWQRIQSFSCGGAYTALLGQGKDQTFTGYAGVSYLVYKPGLELTAMKRPMLKYDVMGVATQPEAVRVQAEIRVTGGEWVEVGPYAEGNHPLVDKIAADLTAFRGRRVELRFKGTFAASEAANAGVQIDEVRLIEPR